MLNRLSPAFTIMEMLIVISIIAILSSAGWLGFQLQIRKAHDSHKKSNLDRIKIAFEDYYSDNNCYPTQAQINNCNSTDLSPYLPKILCNPDQTPYILVTSTSCPQSFQLYTKLNFENDPAITKSGCSPNCGPGSAYNYAVTSDNISP